MSTRNTTLKGEATLSSELKYAATALSTVRASFIEATREGASKPDNYSANEEYTVLFKLGPVVADAIEAIKKLEDNIIYINRYIAEQLGTTPGQADLPPSIVLDNKASIQADANGDITFTSLV